MYFSVSLYFFCFLLLFHFLSLLVSQWNTFYKLKYLTQFNCNPHTIIITIFKTESFHIALLQTESFQVLNQKVSQLKCISLIKLTSALNKLFQLKRNVFLWEKGWNESRRQHTKSFVIVQIFMSVITLGFFV